MDPSISIIIPARNDAKTLRLTLDYLERLRGIEAPRRVIRKRLNMLWLGAQLFYGLRVPRVRLS